MIESGVDMDNINARPIGKKRHFQGGDQHTPDQAGRILAVDASACNAFHAADREGYHLTMSGQMLR
jgi:hypothetical protein